MATNTNEGLLPISLNEYRQLIIDLILKINPGWIIDSSSPDGQLVINLSMMFDEVDQEQIKTNANRDPRQAEKSYLEDIYAWLDLKRDQQRQSKITLDFFGTDGTFVEALTQIRNKTNNSIWSLDSAVTLPAAGNFTSLDYGPISADVSNNNEFEMENVIEGVEGVTNPTEYSIGRLTEQDEEFRYTASQRVALPSKSVPDAVRANIFNVSGVVDVKYIDYSTLSPKENKFEYIVLGGDDTDICTAIYLKKTMCIPSFGQIAKLITSEDNPDGELTYFSRPTLKPVYANVYIQGANNLTDTEKNKIKDNIVKYSKGELITSPGMNSKGFLIGQDPSAGSLYYPVNLVIGSRVGSDDGMYIDDIKVSNDNVNFGKVAVMTNRELSSFTSAQIQVLEPVGS